MLPTISAIFITGFHSGCDLGKRVNKPTIELAVLDPSQAKMVLSVKLHNPTNKELKLWKLGYGAGEQILSFVLIDPSGAEMRIVHKSTDVTSGAFSTFSVPTGSSMTLQYDLMNGNWRWPQNLGSGDAEKIYVELNVPSGPDLTTKKIWSGRMKSNEVSISTRLRKLFPMRVAPYISSS